jgi:Zn-dependent protease with chaperone function
MREETLRLNPFVYISETDIRFYLLVLIGIIMPSLWALTFGIVIFSVMGGAEIIPLFQRLLIILLTFSFIPFLIYWIYKRFPRKIIKKLELREFNKIDHCEYIEKLHGNYLSNLKLPTLMYRPSAFMRDKSEAYPTGFTFGTKNHMYIVMSGGLIKKFRNDINSFKSIFLHEMAHIANGDVEKTYLAASTWKSLFFTLSIPIGIFLLYSIYTISRMLFFGILAGLSMDYIISRINPGGALLLFGGVILYFLIFLGIVNVLRKQIIRLREFYADAKVLEWEESPEELVKTLEECGGEQYSRFQILTKFHPNVNERIEVLKKNLSLFVPSLWVAFAIGFFYDLIEFYSQIFKLFIFSDTFWAAASGDVEYQLPLDIGFRAFISIFIFPILMIAVSSSFHKSVLKDIFIDKTGYFSTATILNVIKFSLAFSFGFQTIAIMNFTNAFYLYEINILVGQLLDIAKVWILHSAYFSITLIFLLIFASMLIRRSFSKKEAGRNFFMITFLSSILYIINHFVTIEILHNKPLPIVLFLVFSVVTYTFIKIKDKKLCCPNCNNKISNLSGLKLNCPNCHYSLYSWAVYSFSKNSVN